MSLSVKHEMASHANFMVLPPSCINMIFRMSRSCFHVNCISVNLYFFASAVAFFFASRVT